MGGKDTNQNGTKMGQACAREVCAQGKRHVAIESRVALQAPFPALAFRAPRDPTPPPKVMQAAGGCGQSYGEGVG
jgi:hypothetical protein